MCDDSQIPTEEEEKQHRMAYILSAGRERFTNSSARKIQTQATQNIQFTNQI